VKKLPSSRTTAKDGNTRLAAVALAWNVFQHFYPYFDVIEADWPRELERALSTAAIDPDERAFVETLRRLLVALHDSHGNVSHPRIFAGLHELPLVWVIAEDKLVIARVAGEAADSGLKPGDVVLAMNGEPIEQAFLRQGALIPSATPQWRRYWLPMYLTVGAAGSEVRLKLRSLDGAQREVVLHRNVPFDGEPEDRRPAIVAELEPAIFYFDVSRATKEDFDAALPKLAEAKAVIFDVRRYPNMDEFLPYLSDEPLLSATWQTPVVTRPDRAGVAEYEPPTQWRLQPAKPRLKGHIVFMTSGRAVSFGESVMGVVEAYRLGDIVGEPTAGSNGAANPFAVPGGYTLYWTGQRVRSSRTARVTTASASARRIR